MLDRLGWNFFVDTHGWPGGVNGMKKSIFFKFLFFQFFYHGQRRALQLVCIYDYRACHMYIWLQSVSYESGFSQNTLRIFKDSCFFSVQMFKTSFRTDLI